MMEYFTETMDFDIACRKIDKTKEEIKTGISELKKWCETQKHLPNEAVDECMLEKFVLSGKGSLERAKSRLDAYFTVRNCVPYIYSNRDPLDPQILKYNDDLIIGLLPGLTPDGSRVMFFDVQSNDPSRFDQRTLTIRVFNILDIWLRDDPHANRLYLLSNSANMTMRHMMKIALSSAKDSMYCLQNVVPVSILGGYFMNSMGIVRLLFENIIKPMLNKKLVKRFIFFGKDYSNIYEDIPLEMMPREFGGKGPSVSEINQAWIQIVNKNREWLLTAGNAKTDESLREGKCPYPGSSCAVM